jgi:hypothetical protein
MNLETELKAANCASRNHMLVCRSDGYYCEICDVLYPLGCFSEEEQADIILLETLARGCRSGRCEL